MNDTHGVAGKGWYAFDLDGTIAKYDKWLGIDHIGEPVKPMVDLIRKMHAEGKVVKILTARVAPRPEPEEKPNPFLGAPAETLPPAYPFANGNDYKALYGAQKWGARQFITDWCARNLGFLPEITHEKDHLMIELYDDRVKQVIQNKGVLVEDQYRFTADEIRRLHRERDRLQREHDQLRSDCGWLLSKVQSKHTSFIGGFCLASVLYVLASAGTAVYDRYFAEKEPARVRMEKAHDALRDLLQNWPEEAK